MKTKLFALAFAIVYILQVYAESSGDLFAGNVTKPLVAIILMLWLYVSTKLKGRFHKRIFAGLLFALAGDIFLMIEANRPGYFTYGLVAFLLCHIFYIRAFILDHKSNPSVKIPFFLWSVGALFIFCIGLFFYLQPFLGSMQFAVLVYAIIITVMAVMALNRYGKVNILSYKLILFGALFFLLSDSVLAVNKFAQPIPQSGVLIMASYMIAQYLIVYGTVVRELLVKRTEI
ncbi:lysoplasmalogenase [Pedobacter frigidisoli]|uniref:lysoplasmalogenase n=1 Tax=Pedobacter frigidisoli TaxID=2530455 RepID=UPI0029303FE5|nr:lysoplasmalogenase [Pedobacter frigidisoli]